ncbi:class I glutamine amidotransferase-like protein [Patellaria atrata CBS 101060]|uniref:Class I glutamine amidotransferase-like protein n=1 Tax=Patellaria atrata CBS 101060 TaxID=1346257 RepID=A0A9P4SA20_9PEZI|nr:class I glutamine amidotransferase-like protein [Patellaria atrata CBS 101060]
MGSLGTAPKKLRIAVLDCDTPLEQTKSIYGSYSGRFEVLLRQAAEALNDPDLISTDRLDITKWDVEKQENYPALEDIDAVLLTGSKANAFDNHPWIVKLVDFIKQLLQHDRVRIIGVCFGHQIVGRALGIKVDRSSAGWETAVTPVQLTGKGKDLFKLDKLMIQQMHKDIVYGFADGVEQLGFTEKCENQGMYKKGKLITVQGHPEFDEQIIREIVESRHNSGIFTDEWYKECLGHAADKHDGVVVAQAFLRFLLEE